MAGDKKPVIIIKKKIAGGHGHHGGAWKVAYADFVTAMMAFFLVMWLMGSDEETKAAISHYFNNPNTPYKAGRDPASTQIHPLGDRVGMGEDVMNGMEGQLSEDLVENISKPTGNNQTLQLNREMKELVEEILEGQAYALDVNIEFMKFSVPSSLIFREGTTQFAPGAEERLAKLGQLFRGYPGYITIEGHTDDQPRMETRFGSAYEFSLAQSVAVMKYLVNNRWTREDKLLPRGSGPRRSLSSNNTEVGRKQNRRIEFILSTTKNF